MVIQSRVFIAQSYDPFVTPWTVARQAPVSMGFSRQEHWSGLPFPSPGTLPNPGIKLWSPALQAKALLSELLGSWATLYSHKVSQFLKPFPCCWTFMLLPLSSTITNNSMIDIFIEIIVHISDYLLTGGSCRNRMLRSTGIDYFKTCIFMKETEVLVA